MKKAVVLSLVLVAMSYGYNGLGSIQGAQLNDASGISNALGNTLREQQRSVDRIQNSTNELMENLQKLQRDMQR